MNTHSDNDFPVLTDVIPERAPNHQAADAAHVQVTHVEVMHDFKADDAPLPDLTQIQETLSERLIAELLADVRHRVAVIIPPAFNRFQHSFGHIFAGGYAAGYYSYKWAEVLSADAYGAFEEAQGDPNRLAETGLAFHREILSVGGSRPALESFTAFRGREPSIDALLRHNGMVQSA